MRELRLGPALQPVTRRRLYISLTVVTEAMVQAQVYKELADLDIRCVLEYRIDRSRFDCAVIDEDGYLAAIVECKNYCSPDKTFNSSTKQYAKYSQYGVPVLGCVRMADVSSVVTQVQRILLGWTGPDDL